MIAKLDYRHVRETLQLVESCSSRSRDPHRLQELANKQRDDCRLSLRRLAVAEGRNDFEHFVGSDVPASMFNFVCVD